MLHDKELLSFFKAGIQQVPYSSSEADKFADETVVCSMYNAIGMKILNMMNDDFVKSLSILDQISSNKRTEAKTSLKGSSTNKLDHQREYTWTETCR